MLLRKAATEAAEADLGAGTLCQEIGRDSRGHKPARQETRAIAQIGAKPG